MNRRGFLTAAASLLAGATLDPERLLWRPGAKHISIPRPALHPLPPSLEPQLPPLVTQVTIHQQWRESRLGWQFEWDGVLFVQPG